MRREAGQGGPQNETLLASLPAERLGGSRSRRPPAAPVPALLEELEGRVTELPDLGELIGRAIVDEPPLAVKEGGMIRDGFDPALDELRTAMRGGKDWIAKLQQDEIARTGIQSLKVRFNSVFGYYIEVTKANLERVPPGLHPQADHCQRRAVHHAGVEGDGRQDSGRGGAWA